MNFRKKLPVILVISLLAGIVGAAAPAYSQAITEQPKLVVFESVGSTTWWHCAISGPVINQLAEEYADQPVVFLDYRFSMALPVEYLPPKSRWDVMKASVPPGTPLALTWTVVDSGRLVHRGAEETEEAYDAYTAMVDDALLQPAQAEITASWRREGGSVNVIATLKNNSTVQLSADNKAGIHAIVKEPGTNYSTHTTIHPGLNAAVTAIPDLAPGETGTFYITVPDLHPTDWDNLEIIVLADYLTAPDGPYNQLQAAFAQQSLEPATLFAEPNSFYFMLGASETAVPQVTTTISGVPGVTWTASVDSPWLSIDHATGTVGQAITLVADATILTPGWNTATILVIDDTGASHTGITMTIYKASVGEDIFRIFLPLIRNP